MSPPVIGRRTRCSSSRGRCSTAFWGDWDVVTDVAGVALEQLPYQPPFDLVDVPGAHIVVLADYVTTDSGTGLVHLSPAFGAEDLAAARTYGLPVVNPIRADGRFEDGVRLVGGQFFKKADATLVRDLQARGLLFRHLEYEHAYPLALPHPASLLRAPVLVHPHHRRQGRAAAGERAHHLVPGDHQVGRVGTGCATTSTGRCHAAGSGAHRCPCGAVTAGMSP